jgi:hypothetical protein
MNRNHLTKRQPVQYSTKWLLWIKKKREPKLPQ